MGLLTKSSVTYAVIKSICSLRKSFRTDSFAQSASKS